MNHEVSVHLFETKFKHLVDVGIEVFNEVLVNLSLSLKKMIEAPPYRPFLATLQYLRGY